MRCYRTESQTGGARGLVAFKKDGGKKKKKKRKSEKGVLEIGRSEGKKVNCFPREGGLCGAEMGLGKREDAVAAGRFPGIFGGMVLDGGRGEARAKTAIKTAFSAEIRHGWLPSIYSERRVFRLLNEAGKKQFGSGIPNTSGKEIPKKTRRVGGGLGGGGGGNAFDYVQMKRDFDFGPSVGGPSLPRTAKEEGVHCSGYRLNERASSIRCWMQLDGKCTLENIRRGCFD